MDIPFYSAGCANRYVVVKKFGACFDCLISDTHAMADGSRSSPPATTYDGADSIRSPQVGPPESSQAVQSVHKRKASDSPAEGSPASRLKTATLVTTQTSTLAVEGLGVDIQVGPAALQPLGPQMTPFSPFRERLLAPPWTKDRLCWRAAQAAPMPRRPPLCCPLR